MRYLSLLLIATMSVCLSACGDDNEKNEPNNGNTPQEMIIGTWVCTSDAYGDRWDGPLQVVFKDDKTGYSWWQDEPFSKRDLFSYSISKTEITLRFIDDGEFVDTVVLEYEFSKDENSITVYGFDDNDMSVLRFTKSNGGSDEPQTPVDTLADQLMSSSWEMVDDGDDGDMIPAGTILTFEKSGFIRVIPNPKVYEYVKWDVTGTSTLTITLHYEATSIEDYLIGNIEFMGDRCVFTFRYYEQDHFEDGYIKMTMRRVK